MRTFRRFEAGMRDIPAAIGWCLSDLDGARATRELLDGQALSALQEAGVVESAISSNRIEGVTVDPARLQAVLHGDTPLRDGNEEEVRGYRDVLELVHEGYASLPVSNGTIQELHRRARGGIGDAGQFKSADNDIIERGKDGLDRVRFQPVSASETRKAMDELIELWHRALEENRVHPLVVVGAFNLDFLCIHPFRDGNGRLSRLLLHLQCLQLGYDVGRYISLERQIEENLERYYQTLAIGSEGWHEGKHDPWPYVGFLLFILKEAYRELEQRVRRRTGKRDSAQ